MRRKELTKTYDDFKLSKKPLVSMVRTYTLTVPHVPQAIVNTLYFSRLPPATMKLISVK